MFHVKHTIDKTKIDSRQPITDKETGPCAYTKSERSIVVYKDVARSGLRKNSLVLGIINQKGGVGKSTTSVNLSATLGEKGQKVLLVDLDPQGNSTSGLGIEKSQNKEHDIYNGLLKEEPAEKLIIETNTKGVFLIPATIQLAGAELDLAPVIAREQRLKSVIEPIKNEFDFIIIDCPPSLGLLTINALTAADELLIPIQCEYYALEGVSKLLDSMKMVKTHLNPNLKIFGVLMTMFDKRTSLSKQVVKEVRDFFGPQVFDVEIPRTIKLSEAPSYGQAITVYDSSGKGAESYRRLAEEVIARV